MKVKITNSLIYGSITLAIYLIAPIIVFSIISFYNILEFSPTFIVSIIIMGSIQAIISYIKNLFPSDSLEYGLICIGTSVYSGIYFFYMFGGFSFNRAFGDYRVVTSNLEANFGLQFFAWLILIASLINSTYYILKSVEILRKKKYFIGKKLKIDHVLLIGIVVIYIIVGSLILSVILNGIGLSFNLKDKYNYSWDTGVNPFSYDDDRIQITSYFDVINLGVYSVKEIHLNIDIYTINTTDITQILLPDNVKIGEINDVYYQEFPANNIIYNESLDVDIIPQYVPGLITNNATLKLIISLRCAYAGITINLNTTVNTEWYSLV
ncbi:MAG: hypothetical protein ACTSPY_05705 [Candidatus Helarchaeota archaeon]